MKKQLELEVLAGEFSVCRLPEGAAVEASARFTFIGYTDEEISLVCPAQNVPAVCTHREDGWRGFRIRGMLDFGLTGILAGISEVLAAEKIGIFAVSTYNTDYIFVKAGDFPAARDALIRAGYAFR